MSSRSRSRQPSLLVTVIVLIIGGALYLFQSAQPKTAAPTPSAPTLPSGTTAPAQGGMPAWLRVYFTDPNPPDNLGSGIDRFVKTDLDGAQQTIDVTSFDLNMPALVNALADAEKRGVKVRVVYDGTNGSLDVNNAASGNQSFEAIKVLGAAKVGLVNGGRSSGLMHDKMVIIDSKILYMGSWNLSYNDSYRNNNNLLRITDSRLIANYQAKFNELFVDKRFGTHAQVQAPNPSMTIDGVAVENYFAPEDGVMAKLVALVQGAHQSVHYMIFTFTHKDLSDAMIARSKAGLDVEGVIEDRGASQGALVPLFCAKLPVKVDGNKYTMHHKVIILDGNTLVTGSFNFTQSADKENDDNLIVIHSAAVAAAYEQEFQKIYGQGKAPTADLKCN
jgi:phosphatidylserine/phosphatidylglycerophosphate/cardiolipin synthase-like enzyme